MGILKKVFYFVLILLILSFIKYILDKYSSISIVFHYNLLTCIQYFLLLGMLLWLFLQGLFWAIKRGMFKVKYFWMIYLGLLCCSEGFFYLLLRNSEKTKGNFHDLITEYYMTYEINFPEIMYDSTLSYTLKKNSV